MKNSRGLRQPVARIVVDRTALHVLHGKFLPQGRSSRGNVHTSSVTKEKGLIWWLYIWIFSGLKYRKPEMDFIVGLDRLLPTEAASVTSCDPTVWLFHTPWTLEVPYRHTRRQGASVVKCSFRTFI